MRIFLLVALLLALTAPQAHAQPNYDVQPVDRAAVAGIINSWRLDMAPVVYDESLEAEALAWSVEMARSKHFRHAPLEVMFAGRHLAVGECIGAGQRDWSEVMVAWINSPPHLEVYRRPKLVRVGLAGVRDENGRIWWTLRMSN